MTTEITTIKNQDWYLAIVEDCKAIIVERIFNSRIEVIEGKWELGERLAKDANYEKHAKGDGFVGQIADDIGCSVPNIYQCLKFYELFPKGVYNALETLGDGKAVSWHKIAQKHLGKVDEKGKPRKTYKLEEIIEAFLNFWKSLDLNDVNMLINKNVVEKFKEHLIKERK